MSDRRDAFLPLWTLAVAATVSAFVLHLALRGRSMQLGYDLGRARQEQSRLREVERVMQLEAASNKTPERVEIVARTLLAMEPPSPDRIISLGLAPSEAEARSGAERGVQAGREGAGESRFGAPMKNLDPRRVRWVQARMGVLCGLMGLALGAIVASAWRVQVEDGPAWREIAEKQRQRRLHIEPKRGTIYDRNHTPLAVSIDVPSVSADVGEMLRGVEGAAEQDAKLHDAVDRLSKALSLEPVELYARLALRHRFVWVKRRITAAEADAVRDLGDPKKQALALRGLAIEGEGHRYYPGRELAGPLLGFVAPDGQGKDGMELAVDDDLRGKIGEAHGLRDRSGRLIFEGQSDERSLQGNDVELTIDEGIQHIAERELDGAMRTYETKGGSLAVIDPMSGEILASASCARIQPERLHGERRRRAPRSRRDRPLRARVGDEAVHAHRGAGGRRRATHRFDQLRARCLRGRRNHDSRHAHQRLADSDPDPRPELEHRGPQDRLGARRGRPLRDLQTVRFRRADGRPVSPGSRPAC
jgi:cell division protein FtsL